MIATEVKMVATHTMSQIRQEAIDLGGPLLRAVALQSWTIRDRVVRNGRNADGGTFGKYAKSSKKRRTKGTKNFYLTGTMWGSLRAKMNQPTRVISQFGGRAAGGWRKTDKGKRVRMTNVKLGNMLQRKEGANILEPNSSEMDDLMDVLNLGLSEDAARALQAEQVRFGAERRQRSVDRRARKAQREMARSRR